MSVANVLTTFNRTAVMNDITRHIVRTLEHVAEDIEQTSTQKISIPVQRSTNPVRVVRSDSGEPPRRDTGALIASHQIELRNKGLLSQITRVLITVPYSKWLEYGTMKMLPRPFIRPTLDEVAKRIKSHFRQAGHGIGLRASVAKPLRPIVPRIVIPR